MGVSEAIYGQRAAREFPPQPVDEKVIRQLVDVAIKGTQCRQPTAPAVYGCEGVANEHFGQGKSIYAQSFAGCARHRPFSAYPQRCEVGQFRPMRRRELRSRSEEHDTGGPRAEAWHEQDRIRVGVARNLRRKSILKLTEKMSHPCHHHRAIPGLFRLPCRGSRRKLIS